MNKEIIQTEKAPKAIGPYSQAVKLGNLVFTSGQLPIDYETNAVPNSIEEQTALSLTNVKNILEKEGLTLDNVIKVTVFMKDLHDFSKMNEVYEQFFSTCFPARSCYQVAALPKDAKIEIEAIAGI